MDIVRESLYDISWKVSEEEYRKDKAYSYSTIARFDREGYEKLYSLYNKIETPSLLFGSMVDTLLTDGQEAFDKIYIVAEFPSISDVLIQIARFLHTSCSGEHRSISTIPETLIASVGKQYDYYSSDKFSNYRVKLIKENCEEYYKLLFLCKNKILVSSNDYKDALDCVNILKTDTNTRWYFESDNPFDKSVERFYQLKFKGEYNGIKLRCMMDLVIVDHDNKTIIPCDLKTSYKPEYNFYKSYIEWKYYIQSSLYYELLRQNLSKHPIYKDYEILDYRFIVISKGTRKPLVWLDENTKNSNDSIVYGNVNKVVCKNWRGIVEDLDYYLTKTPRYPKHITTLNSLQEWLNKD